MWTATGREEPVFLDPAGHRRHWVTAGGATAIVVATAWLCGLVGGAVGFTGLPVSQVTVPRLAQSRPAHVVSLAHRPVAVARRDPAHGREGAKPDTTTL